MTDEVRVTVSDRVTIHVPMAFVKRGGRKRISVPDGAQRPSTSQPTRVDNTLIKALARAFRWRRLLENGKYSSIEELATAETINPSYISRILRLTLLSPDTIEEILAGTTSRNLSLSALMRPFSLAWSEQARIN